MVVPHDLGNLHIARMIPLCPVHQSFARIQTAINALYVATSDILKEAQSSTEVCGRCSMLGLLTSGFIPAACISSSLECKYAKLVDI